MPRRKTPLWTCPKCGHRFVTRNMWHSCGRVGIGQHFEGKDAKLRKLFRRLFQMARRFGPVNVYAQKTRIVFQTRGRFAGVQVRRHHLDVGLWLKRRREHARLYRIDFYPPKDYVHRLRIADFAELDPALSSLMREAYQVGCQEYEDNKRENERIVHE